MENKKLKVAFINAYQSKANRGAERFISDLSQNLISKGHTVDVLTSDLKYKKRWPILWRFFIDPNGVSIALFTIKKLPKLWRENYDILIPTNGGWQAAIIRLLTWIRGNKMLIIGHSGMGWDDRNNLWSFPNCFVAISKKSEKWAKRVNPFVRVKFIPNGIDTSIFSITGPKAKTGLKAPVILCVGALEKNKRIDLTIKAVSKINNASLLVVGDGPEKEVLTNLGNVLMPGRFKITKKPFSKMPGIYRSVGLFTLVSNSWYSFELVLLEAMASGLGVVANDDPIRKDIVGKAGLLVDPTNVKEYSDAIVKALSVKWGNKPREQAQKYDWSEISNQYEELFLKLI